MKFKRTFHVKKSMLKINNERVLRPSPSLIIDQTNVIGHLTVINNEVLTFVFTI